VKIARISENLNKKDAMNEKIKKVKLDDEVEVAIETAGGLARFLDLLERFGRVLRLGVAVAEKIFKPLEVLSSALMALNYLRSRVGLDRTKAATYQRKKAKNEVLAFLSVVAVGLGAGTLMSTGVGAIALIAGGYLLSGIKSLYLIRETNKGISILQQEQASRASQMKAILEKTHPAKDDFHTLSKLAKTYVAEHHRLQEKKEKQKDRKIEIAFTLLATVSFVGAAVFPPLLIPMVAVGLLSVVGNATRPLLSWVKKKVTALFSSGKKSADKAHGNSRTNFSVIDSALGEGGSFSKSAHAMFDRYQGQLLESKKEEIKRETESKLRSRRQEADALPIQVNQANQVPAEFHEIWVRMKDIAQKKEALTDEKEELVDEKEARSETGESVESLDARIAELDARIAKFDQEWEGLNAQFSDFNDRRNLLASTQRALESEIVETRGHLTQLEKPENHDVSHLMQTNPLLSELERNQVSPIRNMDILRLSKRETPLQSQRRVSEEGEGLSG
jgi:hypothetical protein